jgi:hypothetical protein
MYVSFIFLSASSRYGISLLLWKKIHFFNAIDYHDFAPKHSTFKMITTLGVGRSLPGCLEFNEYDPATWERNYSIWARTAPGAGKLLRNTPKGFNFFYEFGFQMFFEHFVLLF